MKYTRKSFLQTTGAGLLGLATSPLQQNRKEDYRVLEPTLKLGLASYTLRTLNLDDTIAATARLGLKYLGFKSMHMPLDSDASQLKTIRQKVLDAGIDLYGAGVVYMRSEAEVNQAFHYAATAGLSVIIGVPNHELLPLVERRAKETNIKVAIHNHGPGDKLYSSADDIHEKVKNLDQRVGFCIDIGHVVRINEDPIEKLKKYQDRLYDMHLKDVDLAAAEGKSVEFGRGIIDFPAVFKTLIAIKYQGIMAIEFEKDGDDPLPGLAECVGYANGLLRLLDK